MKRFFPSADQLVQCDWCEEYVGPGETGIALPHIGTPGKPTVHFHEECYIRQLIGSVAHQQERCSCYGGDSEDDPSLTRHQAALAAYNLWKLTCNPSD